MKSYSFDTLRDSFIGRDALFSTPFGKRHLFYADYTASGRAVDCIEDKIRDILVMYANTHTEDDFTGKTMTHLLHRAERRIKNMTNMNASGRIISVGSGATGALKRLQEIIGVYVPPAAGKRLSDPSENSTPSDLLPEERRPVVFIGPYEHHTNELMWRESLADVVTVPLNDIGAIDSCALDELLGSQTYENREKLCSFSAGSNISGVRSDVYGLARTAHAHDALIFFDFAAIAPYAEINMNRDSEAYFDAVFFSPHKFLGGPAGSGILLFNKNIYDQSLPPTTAGGGTVDFVDFSGHDYTSGIETREKAGTPPIIQTLRAAFAMELKERIGIEMIEQREQEHTARFLNELNKIPGVIITSDGSPGSEIRSIVSFNITHRDRRLHPKFVTKLLNDLFGIQSRAGCSCAGPYVQTLLGIDRETSAALRNIVNNGYHALKPGYIRVNVHYLFSRKDLDFLLSAIAFAAEHGHHFLREYMVNMKTGEWRHLKDRRNRYHFSLDTDFSLDRVDTGNISALRKEYLKQARSEADRLAAMLPPEWKIHSPEIEELKTFYVADI